MNMIKTILAAAALSGATHATELTLDESIDFALGRSPAAVAADATYLSARADLYQGWGGVSPTVSATYSASRYYDRDAFRLGGYEIPGYAPLHYYYASARLDQPVFAGGRLIWGVMSGRASSRAGAASRDEQRQRLVVDVARAYLDILKAQGLKEVSDVSLKASRSNEELAAAQYEAEVTSRAEYLKAVVQRGTDEIAAIAAEAAVVTARLVFFNTVGMEPAADITFAGVEQPAGRLDVQTPDELVERAMSNRPDVVKKREEKRVADLAVRSAIAGWFPSLGAFASYDWSDPEAPSRYTWNDLDEWTVGATASWYLFDGFQTKANTDRARAAAAGARVAYERLRDVVALDVTHAYYEYKKQSETVTVAERTAAAAEEEFAIVQELYTMGGASMLELTDAQARFVEAQNSHVEAKYDFLIADYDLRRGLGELDY